MFYFLKHLGLLDKTIEHVLETPLLLHNMDSLLLQLPSAYVGSGVWAKYFDKLSTQTFLLRLALPLPIMPSIIHALCSLGSFELPFSHVLLCLGGRHSAQKKKTTSSSAPDQLVFRQQRT